MYKWTLIGVLAISGVLVLALSTPVDAGGCIYFKMEHFNVNGRKANGKCCDVRCNACDPGFLFTVSSSRSGGQQWGRSGPYWNRNSINFGDIINGVPNPMTWCFSGQPGDVTMSVDVQDRDTRFHDDMGTIRTTFNLDHGVLPTSDWVSTTYGHDRMSMRMSYKLSCNPNYYSYSCSVHCEPKNDTHYGHYTCNPHNGAKICRPGWAGSNCKIPIAS